jgi:hypothetical protein
MLHERRHEAPDIAFGRQQSHREIDRGTASAILSKSGPLLLDVAAVSLRVRSAVIALE